MKKELDLKFYSAVAHPEKPVLKSIAAGKKFENHIRIISVDDVRPGLFVFVPLVAIVFCLLAVPDQQSL
jgi:hypothetical protein